MAVSVQVPAFRDAPAQVEAMSSFHKVLSDLALLGLQRDPRRKEKRQPRVDSWPSNKTRRILMSGSISCLEAKDEWTFQLYLNVGFSIKICIILA